MEDYKNTGTENTAIKRVIVQQYRAYCERASNGWDEYIAVYDEMGREVARSGTHHPEGQKWFIWKGFEFISPNGYSGNPRTECYVKCTDKIFYERPSEQ